MNSLVISIAILSSFERNEVVMSGYYAVNVEVAISDILPKWFWLESEQFVALDFWTVPYILSGDTETLAVTMCTLILTHCDINSK